VLVPAAVHAELTHSQRFQTEAAIFQEPWLEVHKWTGPLDPLLSTELDRGEAEVIALALQAQAGKVLIDERKGRRVALLVYHLPVIGTGGLLLVAKQHGLLNQIRPLMVAMKANGYFLSERLLEGICRAAGE
jgi:hypothetical protein